MTTAYGAGSVNAVKNRKNYWEIRIFLGTDAQGKNKYVRKGFKGTRKQVELRKAELLRQLSKGGLSKYEDLTFGEYARFYFNDVLCVEKEGRENTIEFYRSILDNHLIPKLGRIKFSKMTYSLIQTYLRELKNTKKQRGTGTLTANSRDRIITVFKAIVRHAVQTEIIPPMPWLDRVKKPNARIEDGGTNKAYALSRDEAVELLNLSKEGKYFPFIALALATGMHISELMGLTWQDMDLETVTPTVSFWRTLGKVGEYRYPKNNNRVRKLSIDQKTAQVMRAHKATCMERLPGFSEDMSPFVNLEPGHPGGKFGQSVGVGETWNIAATSKYVKKLMVKMGLPAEASLKSTRHTHATDLLLAGVPLSTVSERLGHADITMTHRTYQHVMNQLDAMVVKALEKLDYLEAETHEIEKDATKDATNQEIALLEFSTIGDFVPENGVLAR